MSDWSNATIGDVTIYQKSGGTPTSTNPDYYNGDIPFVVIEDITKSARVLKSTTKHLTYKGLISSNAWLIEEPHILYSMYATVGKPIINEIQCATNQAILALKENDLIEQWFLYYYLFYIKPQVYRYTTQTTQSNLNAATVKSLPIYFPNSKAEQRKIIKVLDAVDLTIEKTEALIEKYQQIKAGLMQDLFTRGITTDGKLRPPREQAPELYQETAIGWIPIDWKIKSLGGIAEIVSGVTLGSKDTTDQNISVPYLRVANVQDGYLDLEDVKEVLVNQKTLSHLLLQSGDVLMNEGGDFDKLGRGTVWQGEIEPCIHQNHVFRVRTNCNILRPYYLAYWSESNTGKKYFVISSKQSTNLASINSTQLKAFPIATPCLKEQQRIEGRINAINTKITFLRKDCEKLKQQKSGLMQDLLTGKVPVKVDELETAHV